MTTLTRRGDAAVARRKAFLSNLHRLLDQAAATLGLSDAVATTAHDLINRIPEDAPAPISPAGVERLAALRGVDPRTIRYRIRKLIEVGLAENLCQDGGRRQVVRDRQDHVAEIYGIGFWPLLDRAEEIEAAYQARVEVRDEHARLRREISAMRRRLRPVFDAGRAASEACAAWRSFPRRLAHLGIARLRDVFARVKALLEEMEKRDAACGQPVESRKNPSDWPEKSERPYRTHQFSSETCNPAEARQARAIACGLQYVTLPMALELLPWDWRDDLNRYGAPSWEAVTQIACERALREGLRQDAWSCAEAALGRSGAAVLALTAFAGAEARGGVVRNPGGWVRRMVELAEEGRAQLHRSVFGLLAETENRIASSPLSTKGKVSTSRLPHRRVLTKPS